MTKNSQQAAAFGAANKGSSRINRLINTSLLSGLAILIIVGIVAYGNTANLIRLTDARKRTTEARVERGELLTSMVDAETGARGFAIIGEESYLEPFNHTARTYGGILKELRSKTTAPAQLELIDKINELYGYRLDLLNQIITARRSQGFAAAQQVVASGQGKSVMDEVRDQMTLLNAEGQKDIDYYTTRAAEVGRSTVQTVIGGTLVAVFNVLAAIYIINKELATRKKLQDSLAENEAKLRAVINNMSEGLVVADSQGKFVLFNAAAEAMVGVGIMNAAPDEWARTYGTYLPDKKTIFPTEQFPLVRALKGERVQNVDIYIKNEKQKSGIFINASGTPLRNTEGELIGSIAVFNDITNRKEAETKLAAEKAKAETMLSSIGDGVFAIDTDGRIVLFNRAAELVSGFSAAEVLSRPYKQMLDFHSEKDGLPVDTFITTALAGKRAEMSAHTLLKRKDGTPVPVADSAAPIMDAEGKIQGAVVVFRDITHERQVERMKDEFLSVASHELRTPMGAVRANISMILDGDYGPINKELVEPLTDMKASTIRLVQLVNDLLNVARIEAGRMKFTLSDFDISEALRSVAATLAPLGKEKGLTITSTGEPATVQGDADKVKQILTNLAGNSLKFTDTGSITLTCETQEDAVEITVTDTGVGISADDQEKLFGKFKQIASAQRGKPAGTGLGLHISREMVRKLGGELWIKQSRPGKGSVFAFTLPRARTLKAAKVKQDIDREAQAHTDQK